jgi:AcrR family transcriptional regulator
MEYDTETVSGLASKGTVNMRADARRNYDRLLEVAKQSFAEHGPDASLDDIAKRAGVGSGTLYRHFPTRLALHEAVFRSEVEDICARARAIAVAEPAEDALFDWLRLFVRHAIARRGLAMALKQTLDLESELFTYCHDAIRDATVMLLTSAQKAGVARTDLEATDVLRLASGVALTCSAASIPSGEADRLLDFMLDAMRPRT